MIIKHLGNIKSPLLVCGGAYGNLEALEALAAFQLGHGISDDHVIHTGDTVAYCADAEASVQFMAQRGWTAIRGNVEEQIASRGDDCGCGFEEGSVCDAASQRWYAHAIATLSQSGKAWMAGLPSHLCFTMAGVRVRVVHGSVSRTNRFMFASLSDGEFEAELAAANADLVIAGHTGIPFTRMIGSRCWHNSGALGMPANDATARIWVSVVSPADDGIDITHHALTCDVHAAASKIRAAGLPEGYADGLVSGLWPSPDILPERERVGTGKALVLDGVTARFTKANAIAAE